MQKTVVLIKPDGMQRGLVGEIVHRFERKGLKILGLKMVALTDQIIDTWYAHHKEKSFFGELKSFMQWTPVVAMVLEGYDVIPAVRKIVGSTKGREAEAGSIRGDFGMSGAQNMIHASDSIESAEKEIAMLFKKEEIFDYQSGMDALVYSEQERK